MRGPSTALLPGLASLAAFVRERIGEMAPMAGALWSRREDPPVAPTGGRDASVVDAARALVIVGAAAPFAATSYARARLLRQMHASGLLTEHETEQAEQLLGVAQ